MGDADDRAPSPLDAPPVIENPTDAELVEAARSGDSFAITRLWQRHLRAAWTAARAASGRPDAEPVVVRTAELLIAELSDGRGPEGAVRPHLLALTRLAAADGDTGSLAAEAAAERGTDPDGAAATAAALGFAPPETYRDVLPDGLGDGTPIAVAYASLPMRWQEALWLTEVDGLAAAEVAAELGLTSEAVDATLADARSALRSEWSSLRLAGLPDGSACRAAAAESPNGRRTRSHLDECDGCRAVAAPPEAVSRRALATLPLLLLGAGAGIAFLEAVRRGSSDAATDPVPSVAEATAAATAEDDDAIGTAPSAHADARTVAAPVALVTAIPTAPRRRLIAAAGILGGIAAATALVVTLIAGGAPGSPSMFLAEGDAPADLTEPAPSMLPPVVVATEVPEAPPSQVPPAATDAAPEPTAESVPAPDAGQDPGTAGGTGGAAGPSTGAPAADDAASDDASDGARQIAGPAASAVERAPLEATLGRPGANGWRTLSVTGEPDAAFTVSSRGEVLYAGTLDANGTAALQVRGNVDEQALTLAYGTSGDSSAAVAGGAAASTESARRGRSSAPAPTP
ncbi:hypothetical protein [Agromyces arachidis]|uniref:hypothetical protein n=1 Tax=Agromyces arachidis TaxID=766966 RepID=UPI0040567BF6